MVSDGFRLDTANGEARSERLRATGLFADAVTLVSVGPAPERALVRPLVGDVGPDWMEALGRGLSLGPGSRIGVTGDDLDLAARVACDAAVRMGDRGSHVVLIDASVERPMIEKALREDGDEGFVDSVLFGVSTSISARRTLAPGVRLMTAGSHPYSASDVFCRHTFAATVAAFPDAIVFMVLPSEFVAAAAGALSAVVVVGRSEEELGSVATVLGGKSECVAVFVEDAPPWEDLGAERTVAGFVSDAAEAPAEREEALGEQGESLTELGQMRPETGEPSEEPRRWRGDEPLVAHTPSLPRRRPRRWVTTTVTVVATAVVALVAWYVISPVRRPPGRDLRVERAVGVVRPTEETGAPSGEGAVPPPSDGIGEPAPAELGAPDLPRETEPPRDEWVAGTELVAEERPRASEAGLPVPGVGPGGPYVVFLSSHRLERAAEADVRGLAARGLECRVVTAEVDDRGTWFRVALEGGYPGLAQAREVLDIVKELGYEGAWVARVRDHE